MTIPITIDDEIKAITDDALNLESWMYAADAVDQIIVPKQGSEQAAFQIVHETWVDAGAPDNMSPQELFRRGAKNVKNDRDVQRLKALVGMGVFICTNRTNRTLSDELVNYWFRTLVAKSDQSLLKLVRRVYDSPTPKKDEDGASRSRSPIFIENLPDGALPIYELPTPKKDRDGDP